MSIDEAIEEVAADACEEMILSSRLAMETAYEKPELEKTIVEWPKRFSAKKAAVSPNAKRHTEAMAMREFADELQTIWYRALVKATLRPDGSEQHRETAVRNTEDVPEAEAKASERDYSYKSLTAKNPMKLTTVVTDIQSLQP